MEVVLLPPHNDVIRIGREKTRWEKVKCGLSSVTDDESLAKLLLDIYFHWLASNAKGQVDGESSTWVASLALREIAATREPENDEAEDHGEIGAAVVDSHRDAVNDLVVTKLELKQEPEDVTHVVSAEKREPVVTASSTGRLLLAPKPEVLAGPAPNDAIVEARVNDGIRAPTRKRGKPKKKPQTRRKKTTRRQGTTTKSKMVKLATK